MKNVYLTTNGKRRILEEIEAHEKKEKLNIKVKLTEATEKLKKLVKQHKDYKVL